MRKLNRVYCMVFSSIAIVAVSASSAMAINAPIHVTDDVNLRAGTNTGTARVGGLYRGTSPSFNCWAQGQNISGVDVWFNVTYNGVTGFYASYYDDSHYATDADITSEYGIPQCGTQQPTPTAPAPVSIYFSPYNASSHLLTDRTASSLASTQWWSSGCAPYAARAARVAVGARPVTAVAGWSLGRVGVIRFLASTSDDELRRIGYVLLIDPGNYDELTCDRQISAGVILAHWLTVNTSAHLAVISSSQVSQQNSSRGIQESYFNDIRRQSQPPRVNLRPRVLVCNYAMSHQDAFVDGQYWIQHQIGTTSCPALGGWRNPTAAWHP
jgi:uncharacterized protein YraI